MGCIFSSSSTNLQDNSLDIKDREIPINEKKMSNGFDISGGPLTHSEYAERIESSEGCRELEMAESGLMLRYAYVSQRGYYPEAINKENQDAFCVHEHFCGDEDQALFGVFDGHGEYGAHCSKFTRDRITTNLIKDKNLKSVPEMAYRRSFNTTNQQLHRSTIDDSMSGTTAITVMVRGRELYVANAGDSRAVIAELDTVGSGGSRSSKLKAFDLSHDQTPYRADECVRVKKQGARVLTLDQLEGLKDPDVECWGDEDDNDGDPPRLWSQHGMYPGTAFTRSIGDMVAEKIGVTADPEVLVKALSPSNPFLVIASDGVFEFLSSQSVIDMVAHFDNPYDACVAIVSESYRLWLQYETRTDDITIIIVQFCGLMESAPVANPRSKYSQKRMSKAAVMPGGLNRPVRRGISKAKRQAIESINEEDSDDDANFVLPDVDPKSKDDLKKIMNAVRANFLFSHLNDEQRERVFNLMVLRKVVKDEVIIQQGDKGNHFYVVDKGQFDVFVDHGDGNPLLVHTYSSGAGANPSFGELALMYSKPRAATVTAKTDGMLWSIDRRTFKAIIHKKDPQALVKTLRNVEVLQSLNIGQLQRLADLLSEVEYKDGDFIIRQGEVGNTFFIIKNGNVVCTARKRASDKARVLLRLSDNQYFGERALLSNAPRAANVVACGSVCLLQIQREVFEEVLGPLQHIIDADRRWREKTAMRKESVLRRPSVGVMLKFRLSDLEQLGILYRTDSSVVALMKHKVNENVYTIRLTSIKYAVDLERQANVVRAHELACSLQPSLFVPSVVRSLKDDRVLAELVYTHALAPLDSFMGRHPMSEKSTAFIISNCIIALEHLHMSGVVYRGITSDTVIITEEGFCALVDFRFAKKYTGRTYTLCGNVEFMAPEIVSNKGHTESADFWALGVLAYWLLTAETPFATDGDDELKIYRRITEGKLTMPPNFSSTACDFIEQLLQHNPMKRLGYSKGGFKNLKQHPFLAHIDFELLTEHDIDPPEEILERIGTFPGLEGKGEMYNPPPFEGDTDWLVNY